MIFRPVLAASLLALTFAAPSLLTAAEFSSLEERMSGVEFDAAGLGKLDAAELEALNAWIRNEIGAVPRAAAPASPEDQFGLTGPMDGPSGKVVSQIEGRFTGWDGETTFRLANGQVWQQAEGSILAGVDLDSPSVTISSGMFGAFFLKVEGYNKRVRVKRIR